MSTLKEKKLSSNIIFQGRLLDVRKDEVELPNGKTSTREWINHPGAVCCIPILPDGKITLIDQFVTCYNFIVKKTSYLFHF